ncbi:MAG: hypothetical protein JXR18_11345 [Neptuniibacter sp.]
MKLLIYSDLHTESNDFTIPPESFKHADVLVLAGDSGVGEKAVSWIKGTA